ncbi:MAG: AraC family transcriptional regulator [Methylobacillus sp.]|jgi:AraC family transcriptional regulator|nr:AraC family transcriptional regulator [Methylobacillus sp.]
MLLSETPININHPNIRVLKSSDDCDWPNLSVSVIAAEPYERELAHGGGNDLWMCMAIEPLEMDVTLGRRTVQMNLRPNQICINSPHTILGSIRKNNAPLLHVCLKRELLSEVLGELFDHDADDLEVVSKMNIDNPGMTDIFHILQRTLFEPSEHSALKTEYLARALAAEVFVKHISSTRREDIARRSWSLTAQQIRRVIGYIHEHLASDIALSDLANIAGLSRTLFIQRFKTSFKEPPHQYIIHARIRRAQNLLSTSSLPIVDVALLCGFSDQAHFSRCFRKVTDMTPSRYRQQTAR